MENTPGTSLLVLENQSDIIPKNIIEAVKTLIPAQILTNEAEVRKELPQVLGKLIACSRKKDKAEKLTQRESIKSWSEWRDLNPRPLHPQYSALPGCATLRLVWL